MLFRSPLTRRLQGLLARLWNTEVRQPVLLVVVVTMNLIAACAIFTWVLSAFYPKDCCKRSKHYKTAPHKFADFGLRFLVFKGSPTTLEGFGGAGMLRQKSREGARCSRPGSTRHRSRVFFGDFLQRIPRVRSMPTKLERTKSKSRPTNLNILANTRTYQGGARQITQSEISEPPSDNKIEPISQPDLAIVRLSMNNLENSWIY